MRKIYAKTDETLIEHTNHCLSVWDCLKETYYPLFPDSGLWEKSFLTVLFHDIGKIIDSFQNMINARIDGHHYNYDLNFRHELLSGIVLANLLNKDLVPIAAIFSHHHKLNEELFEPEQHREVKYFKQDIVDFVDYFQGLLSKFGFQIQPAYFNNFPKLSGQKFYDMFWKLIWENISSLNVEDRNKYIFFKGILNTCDWYGSSHNNLSGFLRIDKDSLKEKISKKVDSPIHFDDFQNQCADIASDCLILAPTGSGKTEAALLWSGLKSGKIIYLLPTRVTSNAIYERMKTYFGELNVGLVHSAAIDYHFDKEKDYDTKDYFVEKTFFKPLTVATIDQLLSTGFNVGHWAVKELNCVGAKIIIDEIHAYDFYTLGLTVASIRHFKKSGASFFLMSATIPRFLMELIQKEIPDIKVIKNDSLLNKSRNRFIIKNHGIDGCEQEIAERIHDGKKVLIVVNTVNEAIKLYERYARYEEFSPICYHSRFIVKDRSKKEDEIIKASETSPGGCLVITTQVVEVSLDIDFDILFTENAPADAIIQRAGRINRRRKKPDSAVIIVKHRDVSEKVYNPLLLQKSYNEFSKYHDKPINEEDFLSIVNNVYKDVNVESNENYIAGLGQYKKIQEHYNYIQDVSPNEGEVFTRVRNYLKISVIPDRFLKEVVDLKPHRKAKYLVDVPYWLKKKSYQTGDGFLYCPLDYNKQRGAILDYKMTGDGGCYVL